ncbi:MAG: Trk system potassium transporter TrkA [Clostridia bacterium]|nr:Trk system potassium transporter TrkA [Clostridia bacterium]
MRIVIAGGGKVGLALMRHLSAEGHDIVVIDKNKDVLEHKLAGFDVMTLHGNSATIGTLREANITQADILITATSDDAINILSCLTAKRLNPKIHTIARIRNPEYIEQLYLMRDVFGLSLIINPERRAAREIYRLIQFPDFLKHETFARGRVEIVELKLREGGNLDGIRLMDMPKVLGSKIKVLVCVVVRDGKAFIPNGNSLLKAGDIIYVTAPVTVLTDFLKKQGVAKRKIKNIMIVGGSRVSYYLASILANTDIQVKIIENNYDRCLELYDRLPKASIIHGDASLPQVLESEGMPEMDAVVTLTGIDEQNIITSLYASSVGVPHIATKINRMEMTGMIENMSIGGIVSPKELVSADVVRYVRALQNQTGSANTLHKIANGRAEALEFTVTEQTMHLNTPLRSIQLKNNILLACILRNGRVYIPDGNTTFGVGDTVIIVTTREDPILSFNDIFA